MKYPEFELERFFAKYEFNTKYILCASDCETFSLQELFGLANKKITSLSKIRLGYTESLGDPELRTEISNLYTTVEKDDIVVFSGAEEGIFVIINSLLRKGDHIIVQYPCYQSLFSIAESTGVEVTKWLMDENNSWELDIEFLKNNINNRTKLIIINSPHNPTGAVINNNKYNQIIEIARENNIILLSDEVYRFSEYNKADQLKPMTDLYENGISLGVMSKSFGLPGLRIGWMVTKNKENLLKIANFKDYTTICNSALSEKIAIMALQNKERILNRNLEIIKDNLFFLDKFFHKFNGIFTWVRPKGSPIGFPKILIEENIDSLHHKLLSEKHILIMPSNVFFYGNKNFRIGFGKYNFTEALNHFENFIIENY